MVFSFHMTNFVARVDPHVLASALQEIEGRSFDLTSESGRMDAEAVVERLLGRSESEEQLIDAVVRIETALGSHQEHENVRGGIRTPASATSAAGSEVMNLEAMSQQTVPPIGSLEFDQYMDEVESRASSKTPGGEAVASREPGPFVAHYDDFDRILRNTEHRLQAYLVQSKRPFRDRFIAAIEGFVNASKREERTTVTHYSDRFVVLVQFHSEASEWVSFVLEDGLFVRLQNSGDRPVEFVLRSGHDQAPDNELLRAFENKPELGVKVIHAARRALFHETRGSGSTGMSSLTK